MGCFLRTLDFARIDQLNVSCVYYTIFLSDLITCLSPEARRQTEKARHKPELIQHLVDSIEHTSLFLLRAGSYDVCKSWPCSRS